MGTAATAQVVAEALGMSLPHSALAPSGEPVWLDLATRAARAIVHLESRGMTLQDLLTPASIRNALCVHAAVGGSTNLLLHLPAVAHAAGLPRPTVEDWIQVNHQVPRFVDVLPNGPKQHPTVRVFLAGGVPEIMLHLRRLGVLDTSVLTVSGQSLHDNLDWWEQSDRRQRFRDILKTQDGVDPDEVILGPERARQAGLSNTTTFPRGNLAPDGSVIKSTAIDPSLVDSQGVYRWEGPARVFIREQDAIAAIKQDRIRAGDVLVLAGCGPLGTGMEETYQLTAALKHLPLGKQVALLTDARFSGVSTGACIGHIGPEALAGGPLGKLRDNDRIRIRIDQHRLEGTLDFVGENGTAFTPEEGAQILAQRPPRHDLIPPLQLPADTRLWAALQEVSGGTWGGCVFDVDQILETLAAGRRALGK
jgi:putative YjhG/YagF family dehydratase